MRPDFFNCPACGKPVAAAGDYIARGLKCPACATGFIPVAVEQRTTRWAREREGAGAVWLVLGAILLTGIVFLSFGFWVAATVAIIALLVVIAIKLAELAKRRN